MRTDSYVLAEPRRCLRQHDDETAAVIVHDDRQRLARCRLGRVDERAQIARRPAGEGDIVPWHNSTYRRAAIAQCGERLGDLLEWEAALQEEVIAAGGRTVAGRVAHGCPFRH